VHMRAPLRMRMRQTPRVACWWPCSPCETSWRTFCRGAGRRGVARTQRRYPCVVQPSQQTTPTREDRATSKAKVGALTTRQALLLNGSPQTSSWVNEAVYCALKLQSTGKSVVCSDTLLSAAVSCGHAENQLWPCCCVLQGLCLVIFIGQNLRMALLSLHNRLAGSCGLLNAGIWRWRVVVLAFCMGESI